MSGLHEHLKGTRGAVGVAGTLVLKTGLVEYIGIGNISMRVFGKTHSRIPSNEGIIGYTIQALKIQTVQLSPGEVLLLYTDGIRDHFNASECPRGFFKKDAGWIVENVMKYFYKGDDDAGCIAIRA
jgi:serine/threonine protein phosphatase PrpC